ncbi:M16 family metallopeptidase [Falsibacillus pallidus]|uniref:M16 family metallopeptidase n=1 Tax=Falsibacillus pallidus TaxID=493781 RepID=UPI003D977B26
MKKEILANGVTIIYEGDNQLEFTNIGVFVKVGSKNESIDENGIAHYIEHLLFRTRDNGNYITDYFNEIGAKFGGFTGKEYTSFYLKTLSEKAVICAEKLFEMIFNISTVSDNDFLIEKGIINQELSMYYNNPLENCKSTAIELSFGAHSLTREIMGTGENLEKFTRENIIDFHNRYYYPENIVVSITGKATDELIEKIKNTFGLLKRYNRYTSNNKIPLLSFSGGIKHIMSNSEQAHICFAFNMGVLTQREYFIIYIINKILGSANKRSHLFQTIREKLGLVYSISSQPIIYNEGSMLLIYAACSDTNLDPLLENTQKVLREFYLNGIDYNDLRFSKDQFASEMIFGLESSMDKMFYFGTNTILGKKIYSIEESRELLESITIDDVNNKITEIFNTEYSLSVFSNSKPEKYLHPM